MPAFFVGIKRRLNMSNFDMAFKFLLVHEGGFVNNPIDPGGPTNMGITLRDLSHFYGRAASVDELKNLSQDTAKIIYKLKYWNPINLENVMSSKIAAILFDQGVLRGAGTMIKTVQQILKLEEDGICGPVTIEEINKQQELWFGLSLIKASQLAFVYIVQEKPLQIEFLPGWISRTHSLLDFLTLPS
jgi:lysozyme family protein